MKFTAAFILALLAISVAAEYTQTQTGKTEDDFHEKTDIIRTEEATKTLNDTTSRKEVSLKEGEVIWESLEEDQGIDPNETQELVTYFDEIIDGRLVRTKKVKTVQVGKSKITNRVRRFWSKQMEVKSVKLIINQFVSTYGSELSDDEYTLLNAITSSDGNRLTSNYNYLQIKKESLHSTLQQITKDFVSQPSQEDLDKIELQINECKDGAVVSYMNTDKAETHTPTAWTVAAEVLIATCDPTLPALQLYTFSGSKSGNYVPNMYSEPNSEVVDKLITRWLFSHIGLMFRCTKSPTRPPVFVPKAEDVSS